MTKIIVLSDCHIGSPECNLTAVNSFLEQLSCDRLILAGDFWDLWDMSGYDMRREFKHTIDLLTTIAGRGTKIEYVLGNHDDEYLESKVMSTDIVPVVKSAEIVLPSGRRIAIAHGHRFDSLYRKFEYVYLALAFINKIGGKYLGLNYKKYRTSVTSEKDDNKRLACVNEIHQKAIEKYKKEGYDGLIIGHTHAPVHLKDKFEFVNAGDWKYHNTYVEIMGEEIHLKKFI
jgi:UDP-2,3-diacylglucosamine pyrophosphatase LpxH